MMQGSFVTCASADTSHTDTSTNTFTATDTRNILNILQFTTAKSGYCHAAK